MLTNAHPTYQMVGLKPGQPTYRILIAEDDEASRVLLVKFLVPLGFEVEEARNGAEAVTRWEAWQPHLIFMDMRMPVMDGRQATQAIKSKIANQHSKINTVIVALTASAFEGEQANFLNAGCDDFVRKPFREATLIEILTRHLKVHFVYAPMNGHKTSASETQNEPPNGKKIKTQLIMLNPQWTATMQKATWKATSSRWKPSWARSASRRRTGRTINRLLYNFEHEEILKLLKT
jgi:CheY-like chemotaxis protein